jgi:hypothetical protein
MKKRDKILVGHINIKASKVAIPPRKLKGNMGSIQNQQPWDSFSRLNNNLHHYSRIIFSPRITIFVNLGLFLAFWDSYKYKNMDKITRILETVVRCKYFEAGVHIKNPIKNSYQDGLGRTTQTLDHVVVVHILIWEKRKSHINEYSDKSWWTPKCKHSPLDCSW